MKNMNNEEAKKILKRDLDIMIQNKCLPDGIEAIKYAISMLGVVEQYKWERDVAIGQLEELCLSLGQKVDHVIIKDEIIEYLLDMLEEEHMGMRSVATKDIKDKFGVDV